MNGLKTILFVEDNPKDVELSYTLGVNAYVVKPVDFAQFSEAVRRFGYFWAVLNELPPR